MVLLSLPSDNTNPKVQIIHRAEEPIRAVAVVGDKLMIGYADGGCEVYAPQYEEGGGYVEARVWLVEYAAGEENSEENSEDDALFTQEHSLSQQGNTTLLSNPKLTLCTPPPRAGAAIRHFLPLPITRNDDDDGEVTKNHVQKPYIVVCTEDGGGNTDGVAGFYIWDLQKECMVDLLKGLQQEKGHLGCGVRGSAYHRYVYSYI